VLDDQRQQRGAARCRPGAPHLRSDLDPRVGGTGREDMRKVRLSGRMGGGSDCTPVVLGRRGGRAAAPRACGVPLDAATPVAFSPQMVRKRARNGQHHPTTANGELLFRTGFQSQPTLPNHPSFDFARRGSGVRFPSSPLPRQVARHAALGAARVLGAPLSRCGPQRVRTPSTRRPQGVQAVSGRRHADDLLDDDPSAEHVDVPHAQRRDVPAPRSPIRCRLDRPGRRLLRQRRRPPARRTPTSTDRPMPRTEPGHGVATAR
jgi:hypothetical protein